MNHKEYLGDLIGGSLMLRESQIIAALLLKNPTIEDWNEQIVDRNVLQKRSVASAKRNAATIKNRIGKLSNDFLELVAYGSSEVSSQAMLAATLINSPILADFMRGIVMDAKRMYRESLDSSDWEHFWLERTRLFPDLAKMTESSTYKVAQVAFKVISDAGFINSTRNKTLQNVYVFPEIKDMLVRLKREDLIQAMEI